MYVHIMYIHAYAYYVSDNECMKACELDKIAIIPATAKTSLFGHYG